MHFRFKATRVGSHYRTTLLLANNTFCNPFTREPLSTISTPRFTRVSPTHDVYRVSRFRGTLRRRGDEHVTRKVRIDRYRIELKILQTGRRQRKASQSQNGGRKPAQSTTGREGPQNPESSADRHQSARSGEYFYFSFIE